MDKNNRRYPLMLSQSEMDRLQAVRATIRATGNPLATLEDTVHEALEVYHAVLVENHGHRTRPKLLCSLCKEPTDAIVKGLCRSCYERERYRKRKQITG